MSQKPIAMEQLKQILQLKSDGTAILEMPTGSGIPDSRFLNSRLILPPFGYVLCTMACYYTRWGIFYVILTKYTRKGAFLK